MKLYYVYILKCVDDTYYTGLTNNLGRRLSEHDWGRNPDAYTYNRRPLELVFAAEFTNPYVAIEREKQFKNWSRKKKEALIEGRFEDLPNLAKKDFRKVTSSDSELKAGNRIEK